MFDLLTALAAAFGVVFVAELGDKTQLLALGFGTRHSLAVVAAGLALGYGAANLLAVVVGGVLGAALPQRPIEIVGGLVFLAFAALSWHRARSEDPDATADDVVGDVVAGATRWSGIASIGAAIAIAEMGDKTQITTATLASQAAPIGVWFGATLGATASGMIGAVAGRSIGHRISERAVAIASALLFAAFGVVMLLGWF